VIVEDADAHAADQTAGVVVTVIAAAGHAIGVNHQFERRVIVTATANRLKMDVPGVPANPRHDE